MALADRTPRVLKPLIFLDFSYIKITTETNDYLILVIELPKGTHLPNLEFQMAIAGVLFYSELFNSQVCKYLGTNSTLQIIGHKLVVNYFNRTNLLKGMEKRFC